MTPTILDKIKAYKLEEVEAAKAHRCPRRRTPPGAQSARAVQVHARVEQSGGTA